MNPPWTLQRVESVFVGFDSMYLYRKYIHDCEIMLCYVDINVIIISMNFIQFDAFKSNNINWMITFTLTISGNTVVKPHALFCLTNVTLKTPYWCNKTTQTNNEKTILIWEKSWNFRVKKCYVRSFVALKYQNRWDGMGLM